VTEVEIDELPAIKASVNVPLDAPTVYAFFKKVELFPKFVPRIKKVQVLWRIPPNRQITDWEVDIQGVSVMWKEEDTFDEVHHVLSFRMLEGDFASYAGSWNAEQHGLSTRLVVEARIDWGIPILGRFSGKALERKAAAHIRGFLRGLRNGAVALGRS